MWGYPPLTALIPGYTLHIAWLFQFLIAANKTFAITIRSSMRKWRKCIFLNLLRHFQKIYSCLFLKYLCKVRHHGNYTIYSPVANCSPPNSIFSEICHPFSNYSPLPPTTILGDKIWWYSQIPPNSSKFVHISINFPIFSLHFPTPLTTKIEKISHPL